MRARFLLRLTLVAALAAVTTGLACGEGPLDSTGPGQLTTKSLTGTWSGALLTATMRLTLTQSGGQVSGTGSVLAGGETIDLAVGGTTDNGAFALTVSAPEFESMTYTGTVQVATAVVTMTGIVNGSGFNNQPVTLTKQQ